MTPTLFILLFTLLQLYILYRTSHLLSMKTMQPNSSLALGKSNSKSHRKRICIRSKVKKSIIVSFVVSYSMTAKLESSLQHHSTHHNWNFRCPLLETVYTLQIASIGNRSCNPIDTHFLLHHVKISF